MKELFDTNERSRITQAIEEMKAEAGDSFCLEKLNLAELERRTGVTRSRLRRLKDSGFTFRPHGNTGKESPRNGLVGYTDTLDKLLKSGVTNSTVCLERLQKAGFPGGISAVKDYIAAPQGPGALCTASCGAAGESGQALRNEAGRGVPDGLGLRQGSG